MDEMFDEDHIGIEPISPTSDHDDWSSSASTPVPPEPFQPLYTIKLSRDVAKDGEIVKFDIFTRKINEPYKEYNVCRQYEDLEWLEHCLITQNSIGGLIVPPLPARPAISSASAEAKSKKQLGSSTKTLIGDEFHKDCRNIEKYLRLLANHCIFGQDPMLEKFLLDKEAPARAKVKRGIISKISNAVGEAKRANHRDCEEFFQKERDWVNDYGNLVKETSLNFNKMVYAQRRLAGALAHFSTALSVNMSIIVDGTPATDSKVFSKCIEGLEDAKHGIDVTSANDDATLGFYLELYTRYIESEKEMLYRRTCLLVDYENANKALDKAKPEKRSMAENSKLAAEQSFEDCSDIARQEIKHFHRQRVLAFQESLMQYAEVNVKTARDTLALLVKNVTSLKKQANLIIN